MQKIKDFLAFEGRISVYCIGMILSGFALCSTRAWAFLIVLLNGSPMALFLVGVIEACVFWGSLARLVNFVLKQANDFLDKKGQ